MLYLWRLRRGSKLDFERDRGRRFRGKRIEEMARGDSGGEMFLERVSVFFFVMRICELFHDDFIVSIGIRGGRWRRGDFCLRLPRTFLDWA